MRAFYLNNGSLVQMTKESQIGKGAFGNVYKGRWHNERVAFKCVLIDLRVGAHKETEDLLLKNPKLRGLSRPHFLRLQKETEEFSKPFSLEGPGILQPIAFFRQQNQVDEGRKTIYNTTWWQPRNYNVYVYPLYNCNLYELHSDYYDDFTNATLEHVLEQCLTSLFTLYQNDTTHNDIKPQNFLVKFSSSKKDLMETRIVLTDFGLADAIGGTPMFASPEVGFQVDYHIVWSIHYFTFEYNLYS